MTHYINADGKVACGEPVETLDALEIDPDAVDCPVCAKALETGAKHGE